MSRNRLNTVFRPGVAAIVLAMLWAFGMAESVEGKPRAGNARPAIRRQVVEIAATSSVVSLSADLDGDRQADRISIQNQSGSYELEIDLTTRPGTEITLEGENGLAVGLAVLDTNADRKTDIVVATVSPTHPVNAWTGDGRGGFELQSAHHASIDRHVPTSHKGKFVLCRIAQLTPGRSFDALLQNAAPARFLFRPVGKTASGSGELLLRRPDSNIIGKRGPPFDPSR